MVSIGIFPCPPPLTLFHVSTVIWSNYVDSFQIQVHEPARVLFFTQIKPIRILSKCRFYLKHVPYYALNYVILFLIISLSTVNITCSGHMLCCKLAGDAREIVMSSWFIMIHNHTIKEFMIKEFKSLIMWLRVCYG